MILLMKGFTSAILRLKQVKMKRKIFILIMTCVPFLASYGQETNFNDTASLYFQEIRANTSHYKDLWNLDIYGPILLQERLDLLSHELFHRSQPVLGFHMTNTNNN